MEHHTTGEIACTTSAGFEQPDPVETVVPDGGEQAHREAGGPAHLVGLRRTRQGLPQGLGMASQHGTYARPRVVRIGIPAQARVEAGELGSLAGQDELEDAGEQPQLDGVGPRRPQLVAADAGGGAARLQVIGQRGQQDAVEVVPVPEVLTEMRCQHPGPDRIRVARHQTSVALISEIRARRPLTKAGDSAVERSLTRATASAMATASGTSSR